MRSQNDQLTDGRVTKVLDKSWVRFVHLHQNILFSQVLWDLVVGKYKNMFIILCFYIILLPHVAKEYSRSFVHRTVVCVT